jgi:hypothetical protein
MEYGIRHLIALAVALAVAAVAFACGHTPNNVHTAPTDSSDLSSPQHRVPGEYLVTLTKGSDIKAITDLYGRFGIKSTKDLGNDIFLVTLKEDPGPIKMEELSKQNTSIKAVQPNFVYRKNREGNTR